MVQAALPEFPGRIPAIEAKVPEDSTGIAKEMDVNPFHIVRKYGDKILLKDSDRKPKMSKKKGQRSFAGMTYKERPIQSVDDWLGSPPWDLHVGGDGSPKFLCDVMVSWNLFQVMIMTSVLCLGFVNKAIVCEVPVGLVLRC